MSETGSTRPMTLGRQAKRLRYRVQQGIRTAWYGAHYAYIRRRAGGFQRPGEPAFQPSRGQPELKEMRAAFTDLFNRDLANIEAGLYPMPRDLKPGDMLKTLRTSRALLKDAAEVDRRRKARSGTEVRELEGSDRFPTYYRQNFHYQSDGWLSEKSARLYDAQVEVLFTGAADAMRRMVLAEILQLTRGRDQRTLSLLDVAGGNGRFLTQVMETLPRLKASLLDLSPAYADAARQRLSPWPHVDVIEGKAEAMPVPSDSQDIVTAIYLFHELPPRIRPQVFREIARVLKPGGTFIFADSLQFGDNPPLDGLLEYFPEGFHEPYYKSYLEEDFGKLAGKAGLEPDGEPGLHFLTRVVRFRKP